MPAAYLILGARPGAGADGPDGPTALAVALAADGHQVVLVRHPLGAVRARRRRYGTVVSFDGTHLAARLLRPRGARWHAHVGAAPGHAPTRWRRLLDPRPRVLRRADAVTAAPGIGTALHGAAGVAVMGEPADASGLAAAVVRRPAPSAAGALRLLMLGTVNSPHVEHLALAMRDRGHDVLVGGDVAVPYPPSVLPAAGVDVRPLENPATLWARRLAREQRPDVVHAHWMTAYAFLATVTRLRPLIAMAWGSDVYGATPRQLRQIRFVVRRADVVMTDSQALMVRLSELGADAARSHVLNWGVDLDAFQPAPDRVAVRRALGLGDGPVVLSPRALTGLYNPAVIVAAFERAAIPSAQLVLKHIGATAPDLGRPLPDGARIVGHVPYGQLAAYYRAADVCVSIPASDSSPRSVWEAMACGCACVLSDLPWVHELIEDGVHALVVDPEPDAVAGAVRRLLTEPEVAGAIAANARALVEAHRDRAAEMDRLEALYRRTAARR